jgi:hypothetical protein
MVAQGNALGIWSRSDKKPQLGRPYLLVKQLRTAPLGLGRLAEPIPRTTSGATIGLARWVDFEFSTCV